MQIQVPRSKAGIASIFVGVGLLLLGIGHLLQGNSSQAFADFAGAAGTLGLPSLIGGGAPAPSPVTIETPGPVTVTTPKPSASRQVLPLTSEERDGI